MLGTTVLHLAQVQGSAADIWAAFQQVQEQSAAADQALAAAHSHVLAADPSTTGVSNWFKGNIIPLIILILGGLMMMRSKRGENAETVKMAGPLIIGLGVIGLALTNSWEPFSKFLIGLLGG